MQAGESGLVLSPVPGESSGPVPLPPSPGDSPRAAIGAGSSSAPALLELEFPSPPAPDVGARPGRAGRGGGRCGSAWPGPGMR